MNLCVALDLLTFEKNISLLKKLKDFNHIWFKVGFSTYIRDGHAIISEIKTINPNAKIFLDLKLYDIPNTMASAAEMIMKLGIDMFNIHASAGKIAMSAVIKRLEPYSNRPTVIAVTALTSFDEENFYAIYNDTIEKKVNEFVKDAAKSSLDGVVCSAFESGLIKKNSKNFLTVSPGIRPFGEDANDQKRVATLEVAKRELVDLIVVGRAIYASKDPIGIVQKILNNIS